MASGGGGARGQKVGGVEVDLAFGASRLFETTSELPKIWREGMTSEPSTWVQDLENRSIPVENRSIHGSYASKLSSFWSGVESAWAREGGWRADPGYRGRGVVVSAARVKRAGAAGRTVGVVEGRVAAGVMEWEDNWPALSAQAEMLLTRLQIFTFTGYSHHYGGFWRLPYDDDDMTSSDRAVSYPYTEAGLQAVTPLWLVRFLLKS